MPKMQPTTNLYGRSVADHLPMAPETDVFMTVELARIWALAAPLLSVRNNDAHSLYAYSLATALLAMHPEAESAVVLPAILLHDIGWSTVPPEDVLSAIAPGGGRPELVLLHEREGARLAREILASVGYDGDLVERIVAIIDGHDSRLSALSLEDAIVKDADKTWRLTPHGLDTVMDWFGLERAQALRLCSARVRTHLFTDAARNIATTLIALESASVSEQMRSLP